MELLTRHRGHGAAPRGRARRRTPASIGLALGLAWLSGCIGQAPEEREPAVQGDYRDGSSEHRPGQPCINCHSDDPLFPIAPPFELGGTVYDEIDAAENEGIGGVEVLITDDAGHELVAHTNRVGNFFVELDEGLDAPERQSTGRTAIPWRLTYPLRVSIRRGDVETPMETRIWRSGSCATCHGPSPGADSVGRVYLDEEAAP